MKTDLKSCIESIRRTGCAVGYHPRTVRAAWRKIREQAKGAKK